MLYTIIGFTSEDFEKFSSAVNNLKPDEKLTLFLDSGGGRTLTADMYLKVINSLKNVELIGVQISSSAFDVFYKATCPKVLMPSVFGMVHKTQWNVNFSGGEPHSDFERFQLEYNAKALGYPFLKKKERKIYERGGEVWMDYDRLVQIFPEARFKSYSTETESH